MGSNCTAYGNTCYSNTANGTGRAAGIKVGRENCRVEANNCAEQSGGTAAYGIYLEASTITATGHHFIVGNTCRLNTTAGIYIDKLTVHAASGSTVQGNLVTENGTGILLDTSTQDNLVIGNRANGNTTPYDIPVGNSFGPFVDETGGGEIGTTDPLANIYY